MQSKTTTKLVMVASLAAISYVLMFFSVAILPSAPFLKLDLAEVPILISFYLLGWQGGVATAVIRTLLYLIVTGFGLDHLIGVSANLIASLTIGLVFYGMFTLLATKKFWWQFLSAAVVATLALTVVLAIFNYYVLMPLYMSVLNMKLGFSLATYVTTAVIPFNLIKGSVVFVVFGVLASRLKVWLQQHSLAN